MQSKQRFSPLLVNALLEQPDTRVFKSGDVDEVHSKVGDAFKPHRLTPTQRNSSLDSRLHQFSMGHVSFHRLKYGAAVEVDPDCLEDFFLIQMPVSGQAEISCGDCSLITSCHQGVVLNPTQRLKMHYDSQCDQLMLRIDRRELERICSRYLGHSVKQPVQFDCHLNWRDSPAWIHMLEYITQMQRDLPECLQQPLITRQLEELVISTLLSQQVNNYSEELSGDYRPLAPRHVKRVEEYIEAHAQESLTPAMLAEIADVSVRTLYAGFREFRHMSPMEFLRNVRLQRIHEALSRQDNHESVTDIAMHWGFTHMGRFSQEYQKLFGEKPSETKRKAQA
ncbi:AraC family transcriptional regulator [Marinobacterium sediminicola]|uniref:Transcriptional regulator, AraC family n=1 Tax=Marinobacterium sediminicola TaxID=518898 RepID=A0ABY1S3B1_9GAMM|nr:AraC family transcriptional regulator [Marinobacterium sediminicola]ULG68268.1 AraC family transcriptional regulator [Marinobacterium sediminicola]SMR77762.1 transcriptional regulator, AraC family [Marinobacterium sediminicola]